MPKNNTLTYRVQQLEKKVDTLCGKVDIIRTNHFPTLEKEITTLRTRINVMTAINVGAVIIGALILKYL